MYLQRKRVQTSLAERVTNNLISDTSKSESRPLSAFVGLFSDAKLCHSKSASGETKEISQKQKGKKHKWFDIFDSFDDWVAHN